LPVEKKMREKKFCEKISIFLAYVTPWLPMSVLKKIQPIRSGRLDGQGEHIYECLILLYIDNVKDIYVFIT